MRGSTKLIQTDSLNCNCLDSLRNVFGITAMRSAELEEPLDFNGLQQNRAIF